MKTFKKVMIWTGAGLLALVFFAMSIVGAILVMKTIFTSACQAVVNSIDIPTFEEECKYTDDGFRYYSSSSGVIIIEVPNTEEITIPEYIDGKKVTRLGYIKEGFMYRHEYYADFSNVRRLTIQHSFDKRLVKSVNNINLLTYIDYLYCLGTEVSAEQLIISNNISRAYDANNVLNAEAWLLKSNRKFDMEKYEIGEILIPEYVTVIEDGVFDGLEGTVIKTEYESQPAGWEDGWNGDCEVIWGAEL